MSSNLCYKFLAMSRKSETDPPKPDVRSWCRPLPPTWGEAMQLQRLTGEMYKPMRKGDARASMVRSVRLGSIVEVWDAFLLAIAVGRADVRYRDLVNVMDEIEERGASIRELSTGDETPRHRRRMRERARRMIGDHNKGRQSAENGKLSTGAPQRYPRKGPEYEIMEAQWYSRRNKNANERRVAIKQRLGYCPSRVWLEGQFGTPHGKQASGER